jgi:hypothetical protein
LLVWKSWLVLVPLWLKWLKESIVSPEKLVDVGNTVAELAKGELLVRIIVLLCEGFSVNY